MIPPTSIDGTDITGATIDGTDVQEITVDGDTVFTAQTIIDDFEDANLNEYTSNSAFSIDNSNPISGSHSLRSDPTEKRRAIFSTSGLANYPEAGDTFSVLLNHTGNENNFIGPMFGVQSNNSDNYCWIVRDRSGDHKLEFMKNSPDNGIGSRTAFSVSGGSFPKRLEINWGTNGVIQAEVYEDDTNTSLGSASVTDTSYTSGGVGFYSTFLTDSIPFATDFLFDDFLIL